MSYRGLFLILLRSFPRSIFYTTFAPADSSIRGFHVPSKLHTSNASLLYLSILALPLHWSCPRPISYGQLHTLLHFHLRPIYLVVFKGSYCSTQGYLILRGASRLDAFSVYPLPAWLLCHGLDQPTDPPAASPSRSSRTKDSSSQISYAHAG